MGASIQLSGQPPSAADVRGALWGSRARNSRPVGVFMLALSGALFLVAFSTGLLLAEVASLTAFVFGALLLVSSFEPRLKLIPSVQAMEGPVRTTVALLRSRGWTGKANFVIRPDGVQMRLDVATLNPAPAIEVRPYGHDLLVHCESLAGKFDGKGMEFLKNWLPRALADASDLVESASITQNRDEVSTRLVRPFVRPMCVEPFFTENVCGTLGCPLVNSIGEALATATRAGVSHVGCVYDPLTQTATAVHALKASTQQVS